jgi:predicted secreted protein
MATHKGSEGTVKVGSNAVAEIRSYSIEESADTLEITSMGDTAREYVPSLTSFSGSLDVFWDETDASGQGALTIGSEVTLNVYPEGDTAGDTYYTGSAIVTGVSRSASFDGLVEASISVQGNY